MDRLEAMRVFVRIVERGSFVRAAEDLGLPASTATDAIQKLEQRLGVRLLQRTTRQVRSTPDGDAYYRRCVAILADMDEADNAFRDVQPRGLLRADVLGAQARKLIIPGLPKFLDTYPEIELYLTEGAHFVDLVREGIDCVIRTGELADSELVGRRVALFQEVTVASPEYVTRFGKPERWDRLDGHRMIGFRSSTTGGVLPLEFTVDGSLQMVTIPAPLTLNGADTIRDAALRGLGIIQVPHYAVAQDIEDGSLVELLPDTPPSPTPVHVLYPRNRQLSRRVRVFIDWVAGEYERLIP